MARSVYSRQLLCLQNEPSGSFTVPDGYVAVVREINYYNGDEYTITEYLYFYIKTIAIGATIWQFSIDVPVGAGSRYWPPTGAEGHLVLPAGDGLQYLAEDQSGSPVGIDLTISGYLLTDDE